MYAEVIHLAPSSKPIIDALLEKTQIPPHSEWSGFDLKAKVAEIVPSATNFVESFDVTKPIRHSANVLQKASYELRGQRSGSFDKF